MRKWMWGTLTAFFVLTVSQTAWASREADDKMSGKEYVEELRKTALMPTWAKLGGTLSHYRRGQGAEKQTPIYMGMVGTPNLLMAQLVIGGTEAYRIAQRFGAEKNTIVTPLKWSNDSNITLYGVSPEDLTFSFLYWDFVKEYPTETMKLHTCRVLELKKNDSEHVKVWVAAEYRRPLQVEWYRKGQEAYYRKLKISGISKSDNDLWLVSELYLDGPGWRTSIKFPDREAGYNKDGIPPDLYKKNPNEPVTDSAAVKL